MLVRIQTSKFLETFRRVRDNVDSYGFNAWKRTLDESKQAMHEHGYQNKSGQLTASMQSRPTQAAPFAWRGELKISAPHAQWVDRGTGVYGPHHSPIVPTRAQFLRFYWDKVGAWVFARSVRGMPGAKFSKAATDVFLASVHSYLQGAVDSAARSA